MFHARLRSKSGSKFFSMCLDLSQDLHFRVHDPFFLFFFWKSIEYFFKTFFNLEWKTWQNRLYKKENSYSHWFIGPTYEQKHIFGNFAQTWWSIWNTVATSSIAYGARTLTHFSPWWCSECSWRSKNTGDKSENPRYSSLTRHENPFSNACNIYTHIYTPVSAHHTMEQPRPLQANTSPT